jgi:hypothetical protein
MQLRRRLGAHPSLAEGDPQLPVDACGSAAGGVSRRTRSPTRTRRPKGDRGQDSFKTIGPDHLWDPIRYVAMCRTIGPVFNEPKERGRRMDQSWPPPREAVAGLPDLPVLLPADLAVDSWAGVVQFRHQRHGLRHQRGEQLMRIVETAALAPAMCSITKSANGPFIDLLRDFDYDHAGRFYIKTSVVREMAEMCGAPREGTVDQALGENEVLRMRVAELEAEVASLREFEQSAKYTLEHFGEKARRKPGRKPQEKPQEQAA